MGKRDTELALKMLNLLSDEGATIKEAENAISLANRSISILAASVKEKTELRKTGRFEMPECYRNDQTGSNASKLGGTRSPEEDLDKQESNSSRSSKTLEQNSSTDPSGSEADA